MSVTYIHLANLLTTGNKISQIWALKILKAGRATTLETFWKERALIKILDANPDIQIFLDSGAHSLLNAQSGLIESGAGVETEKRGCEGDIVFTEEQFDTLSDNLKLHYSNKVGGAAQLFTDASFNANADVRKYLDAYIAFIHKYKKQLSAYVNLDIVYHAEESWDNQKIMESNGLRPIPVFHYGEDFKWLYKYVDEYDYIGIGGVAGGITIQQFVNSLGQKAFDYINKHKPGLKIHGFAVTSFDLMHRFPWYSVDSTTWLKFAAFGQVLIPRLHPETYEFDYSRPPQPVAASDQTRTGTKHRHYTLEYSPEEVEQINRFITESEVTLPEVETTLLGRFKVNQHYYEQLLKSPKIHEQKTTRTNCRLF